jgi:hypothetical protein
MTGTNDNQHRRIKFALLYGGGDKAVARLLNIPEGDVQRLRTEFKNEPERMPMPHKSYEPKAMTFAISVLTPEQVDAIIQEATRILGSK